MTEAYSRPAVLKRPRVRANAPAKNRGTALSRKDQQQIKRHMGMVGKRSKPLQRIEFAGCYADLEPIERDPPPTAFKNLTSDQHRVGLRARATKKYRGPVNAAFPWFSVRGSWR